MFWSSFLLFGHFSHFVRFIVHVRAEFYPNPVVLKTARGTHLIRTFVDVLVDAPLLRGSNVKAGKVTQ